MVKQEEHSLMDSTSRLVDPFFSRIPKKSSPGSSWGENTQKERNPGTKSKSDDATKAVGSSSQPEEEYSYSTEAMGDSSVSQLHDTRPLKNEQKEVSFDELKDKVSFNMKEPLSEIIRPQSLEEYIGQEHLLNARSGVIRNFIRLGYLPSIIFYGGPGVGKTTLARILAKQIGYEFITVSAADVTMKYLKELVSEIREHNKKMPKRSGSYKLVLFIDETHRLSRVQQDYLLPHVESGLFSLIGATTVYPNSRVSTALRSRCLIFELKALKSNQLKIVFDRAIMYENMRRRRKSLVSLNFTEESVDFLIRNSSGDVRVCINMVELMSNKFSGEDRYQYKTNSQEIFVGVEMISALLHRLKLNKSGLQSTQNIPLFIKLFHFMRSNLGEEEDFNHPSSIPSSPLASRGDNVSTPEPQGQVTLATPASNQFLVKISVSPLKLSESDTSYRRILPGTGEDHLLSDKEMDYLEIKPDEFKNFGSPLQKYLQRLYESADSDADAGSIYSDSINSSSENESLDLVPKSREDFYIMTAVQICILLLRRGENPRYILKQLVLFLASNFDADKLMLCNLMGVVKSFDSYSSDVDLILTNCVEDLTRLKKKPIHSIQEDPIATLKVIKRYCRESQGSARDHHPNFPSSHFEVTDDPEKVSELLSEASPDNESYAASLHTPKPSIFEISYLSDEDALLSS